MKKFIFIIPIVVILFASYYFVSRLPSKQSQYSSVDSRTRMKSGSQTTPIMAVTLPTPNPESLNNLKSQLPYTSESFSISWDNASNQAVVIIFPPYDTSTASLISWIAQIDARDISVGTLKIIKK